MPVHNPGLHHFHRRKRIYVKHEPYPHPDKWKRMMDKLIYAVAFIGPIMTIPQVTKIWLEKNAGGISIIAWLTFAIINIFWVIYGVMHKEKPIIFSSSMLFVLNLLVVIGAFVYM